MTKAVLNISSIADVRDPSVERTLADQDSELEALAEQMGVPRGVIDLLTIDQARNLAHGKLVLARPSGRALAPRKADARRMRKILVWMRRMSRHMRKDRSLLMDREEVIRVVYRHFQRQCFRGPDIPACGGAKLGPRAA